MVWTNLDCMEVSLINTACKNRFHLSELNQLWEIQLKKFDFTVQGLPTWTYVRRPLILSSISTHGESFNFLVVVRSNHSHFRHCYHLIQHKSSMSRKAHESESFWLWRTCVVEKMRWVLGGFSCRSPKRD